MRCTRLELAKAPGLPHGLPEIDFQRGLVVIVGPNGSGKSTLARGVRALLWDGESVDGMRVRSEWERGGVLCTAELFAGTVHWDPKPDSPAQPGAAGLARLGIRSLLADDEEADAELGRRLLRELSGGFDLIEARDAFQGPVRLAANSSLARRLKSTRQALDKATAATDSLTEREAQLEGLEARIVAAAAARARHDVWRLLEDRLEAEHSVESARAELDAFEEGLEQIPDDAVEVLDALEKEQRDLRDRRDTQLAAASAAKRASTDNAFPGEPPEAPALEEWKDRLDALGETERTAADLSIRLEGARIARDAARAAMLTEVDEQPTTDPTPATLDALAESLHSVRNAAADLRAATGVAEAWAAGTKEDQLDADALRRAVDDLRTWLRSPVGSLEDAGLALLILPLIAALLAMIVGFGTGVPLALRLVAWAAFVASTIALVVHVNRRRREATAADQLEQRRRQIETRAWGPGLAPERWETDPVSSRLEELERRLVEHRLELTTRDRLTAARSQVSADEQRLAEARSARDGILSSIGIRDSFAELGAVSQAQALARLNRATAELAKLESEYESALGLIGAKLGAFSTWIGTVGLQEEPATVAAARAIRNRIEQRRSAWLDAERLSREAEGQIGRVDGQLARKAAEIAGTWERAGVGVGDRAGLYRRVEALPAWRAARRELRNREAVESDTAARFETARTEVSGDPAFSDVDITGLTLSEVTELRESAAQEAAARDELVEEQARIRASIEQARDGHELSDALAAVRAAERAVADERDRVLENTLARELLDEARAKHEVDHAPPVLRRAQELLSRFTHDSWHLELDPQGAFRALDVVHDAPRSLAELSDGTRSQLLLAARLAALEGLEADGDPVPLCLDEALANSDPLRFHEVAGALLELVDAGRQVLYLTADPGEYEQWRAVCRDLGRPEPPRIDLGGIAGVLPEWGADVAARPAAATPLPDPADMTHDEYLRALRVPLPDGHEAVSSWHLYLVAYDDLHALRACLERRLSCIGPWHEARRRGRTPPGVDESVASRFDDRHALAAALCEAWRIGRGRPVTWDDVEGSGAISSTFEDDVRGLLATHARDARALLEKIGTLRSFRTGKLSELEDHLETAGCLSSSAPLSPEEMVGRALQAAPDAAERLGRPQSGAYLDWLVGLLQQGG